MVKIYATIMNKNIYNKPKEEETAFNVGDTVRYIINLQQFEKGTLPRWSKATPKIV